VARTGRRGAQIHAWRHIFRPRNHPLHCAFVAFGFRSGLCGCSSAAISNWTVALCANPTYVVQSDGEIRNIYDVRPAQQLGVRPSAAPQRDASDETLPNRASGSGWRMIMGRAGSCDTTVLQRSTFLPVRATPAATMQTPKPICAFLGRRTLRAANAQVVQQIQRRVQMTTRNQGWQRSYRASSWHSRHYCGQPDTGLSRQSRNLFRGWKVKNPTSPARCLISRRDQQVCRWAWEVSAELQNRPSLHAS